MDVLEEQLQIVLGTWASTAEQPFSFTGEHYALTELDAEPTPVQDPHPPLLIGGSGGRRSCRLAARYADEYNTVSPTVEDVAERRARLAAACEAEGRPMLPFSIMTCVLAGADDAEVDERVSRLERDLGATPGSIRRDPHHGWIIGTVTEVVDQLRALAAAGVDRVFCQHLQHDDLDGVALIGERLAPLVATGEDPA
jgi:alkanesulfonate monooxygenase SsuD/methylene tetrahydromethanopterin reductase-like flavin-dependent oxidoreductase (luciferase family)